MKEINEFNYRAGSGSPAGTFSSFSRLLLQEARACRCRRRRPSCLAPPCGGFTPARLGEPPLLRSLHARWIESSAPRGLPTGSQSAGSGPRTSQLVLAFKLRYSRSDLLFPARLGRHPQLRGGLNMELPAPASAAPDGSQLGFSDPGSEDCGNTEWFWKPRLQFARLRRGQQGGSSEWRQASGHGRNPAFVKCSRGAQRSACHSSPGSPAPDPASCQCAPWEKAAVVQVLGPRPPVWETWHLASLRPLWASGE